MTVPRGSRELLPPGAAPVTGRPPTTPSALRPAGPRLGGTGPAAPTGPRGTAAPGRPATGPGWGTPPTIPRPTGPPPRPACPDPAAWPTGPSGGAARPASGPDAVPRAPWASGPVPARMAGLAFTAPVARPCAEDGTLDAGIPPGPVARPTGPRAVGCIGPGAMGRTGPFTGLGPAVVGGATLVGRAVSCGGSVPTLLISVPTGRVGSAASCDAASASGVRPAESASATLASAACCGTLAPASVARPSPPCPGSIGRPNPGGGAGRPCPASSGRPVPRPSSSGPPTPCRTTPAGTSG